MSVEHQIGGRPFLLAGARLVACASGALWWPDRALLAVSDLHLGKSERIARRGGPMLPPYETRDTLERLDAEVARLGPRAVVCLGDTFDDPAAAGGLEPMAADWLTRLMAGRRWVWIEGNHDPGPVRLGGTHLAELQAAPLVFRHIARPGSSGEVSGHYHPKASVAGVSRRCFLYDSDRAILPAFGTYTGGLRTTMPVLSDLMRPEARAILTGPGTLEIPMPGRASG